MSSGHACQLRRSLACGIMQLSLLSVISFQGQWTHIILPSDSCR